MMLPLNQNSKQSAFSLIEVAIALAIASVVLISIIGVVPVALKNERESLDHSALGTIYEDAHERLEGVELTPGTLDSVSPIFYDLQGVYLDPDDPGEVGLDRYFRVEVELIEPADTDRVQALAVKMDVFWPVNVDGSLLTSDQKPGNSVTYYAAALTGPGWQDTDPNYKIKIEY